LLWSNIVISIAAASTAAQTLSRTGNPLVGFGPEVLFSLGIGAATWCAYTWQRHVKSTRASGLRPEHRTWHRKAWPLLRIAGLVLLPLAALPLLLSLPLISGDAQINWRFPIVLSSAFAITLLYAGLPGESGVRQALRRIPGIKMLWIGLAWSLITAWWPLWWQSQDQTSAVFPLAMGCERFLVIAALTLPFDLRDRNWDPAEMRTWPQLLGLNGTRMLALVFLLAGAWLRWGNAAPTTHWTVLGLLPMAMAVLFAKENRSSSYYAMLDGLLIVDAAIFLV
jgi:hypothetical protein